MCMIQLIFIMPSSQVSAESFDVTKQTCCYLPSSLYRVYTVCLHLEQTFETVLEKMKLDTDVLEETFTF